MDTNPQSWWKYLQAISQVTQLLRKWPSCLYTSTQVNEFLFVESLTTRGSRTHQPAFEDQSLRIATILGFGRKQQLFI
jgi:hypothetical protein